MTKPRTLQEIRKAELSQILIAKKQLGWDDDTDRAAIRAASKGATDSSADLDYKQRKLLLDRMKASGFKVRHARKPSMNASATPQKRKPRAKAEPSAPLDRDGQSRKIRSLWLELHERGEVRNPDETAMLKYVERETDKLALQFLTIEEAQKLIEKMKKWLDRVKLKPFREVWLRLFELGVVKVKHDAYIRASLLKSMGFDVLAVNEKQYQEALQKLKDYLIRVQSERSQ